MSLKLWIRGNFWMQSSRNDMKARELADRHYSRKTIGARDFVGPGETLILVGDNRLWVSRKCKFRMDKQYGIECSIFRNESQILSSELIKEAVKLTREYWPGEPIFTYVNPYKIKSVNPGCCFLKAGFRKAGTNKSGRLILLKADYR